MPKSYEQDAEESALFLNPAVSEDEEDRRGERDGTSPLREARLIPIERIRPDPDQPRKTFNQETLNSLADSIRDLGGVIDPLTVQYDENHDHFRILSGERRYRAANLVGLEKLPCIIKEIDKEKSFMLQLMANLQREDIRPLEESDAIRSLIERFGYSQANVAKLLNRSQSYVSQIVGLQRLAEPAKEILQTSEVPKEIQIKASKEKDPRRQKAILKKASEEGKTVRQIREEDQTPGTTSNERGGPASPSVETPHEKPVIDQKGRWSWSPEDGSFVITIEFNKKPVEEKEIESVRAALDKTRACLPDEAS
ncbi:MAG: ParB/RepB/Spo0J family partition protein [Desulfobacteraceae bacterium]|jgi:ParB family chromosome partitioning protein|nr:MAG: ParB/RepB/Spo0J family partition protein [Desulfobacteraceae bacterium]